MECVFKVTMNAYKRRMGDLKSHVEMAIHGKQPMRQSKYHYLAEAAPKQNEDFNKFPLLFVARAASDGTIVYVSISWEGYAITIHIGKRKSDQ